MSRHSLLPFRMRMALPEGVPSDNVLRERDERLRSLKELVAHMVHDFNNCLVPLMGYVSLLSDELKPGAPGAQYLAKLETSVKKGESLIQAIVQATHPERYFFPRKTDLSSLVDQTVDGWMKALPGSSTISVDVQLAPCTLWIDERQWSAALLHLLRNAERALAGEGSLWVTLQSLSLTPAQAHALRLAEANAFLLTIEDTGGGMSEDVLKRAFDPLYSGQNQPAGAGLGLTLVHSIVQLHGGQIAVHSEPGVGTAVQIWLPSSAALEKIVGE